MIPVCNDTTNKTKTLAITKKEAEKTAKGRDVVTAVSAAKEPWNRLRQNGVYSRCDVGLLSMPD